jgi:hypothetical protein
MHLKSTAALCFGLVLFGLAAQPAQAQTRQRVVAADGTRITTTDESGRRRTRVVIQRRSFLDGGTEVLPGSKSAPNNMWPTGYSPIGNTFENTNFGGIRHPLPGPFDLPGKDNPFPSW